MTISRDDLVAGFPEFGNETTYPPSQIEFWIGEAVKQVAQARFGASYDLACMLFVAHNISLSAMAQRAAAAGGGADGGVSLAPVTSKSVGPVSKSVDVTLTAFAGAGPWNATAYGQRYYAMLRAAAVGPAYSVKAPPGFARYPYPR